MSTNRDKFESLIKDFAKACEDIGLYAADFSIASDNPERAMEADANEESVQELIDAGEIEFVLLANFRMNDFALSDDNLFPEKVKEKEDFDMIVPDAYEQFKSTGGDLMDGFD